MRVLPGQLVGMIASLLSLSKYKNIQAVTAFSYATPIRGSTPTTGSHETFRTF